MSLFISAFARLLGFASGGSSVGSDLLETTTGLSLLETTTGLILTET